MVGGTAATCAAALGGVSGKSGFVCVDGPRFVLDGYGYRYVGTNLWYGAYLGSASAIGNRDRLKRELDRLHAIGIDNVRILGASEQSPLKNSLPLAFHGVKQAINKELLAGLDYVLVEMGRRGMKAVIYLNNFWEWSGGMATYQYWTNGGHYIDAGDPKHPWPEFADFSARFYTNTAAIALYEEYVAALVRRTNSITGARYCDDTAIMSWQLANEPRPGGVPSVTSEQAFYAWVARSAEFIKMHDPNHLVSIGSEGTQGCFDSSGCFAKAHMIKNVDYVTFHLWPLNWGWIDQHDVDATFDAGCNKCRAYVDAHVGLAAGLKKPLVLEEFGFPRDGGGYGPDVPTTYRDRFFRMVYESVEAGGRDSCFAGTNFWAWGGEGRAEHPDSVMRPADTSYVGDPPQEPQGANSVFDRDRSTIAVVQDHVAILRARSRLK